jgi:hypothetical protein
LRHRLLQRIQQFRRGLAQLGLRARGGSFPVQSLAPAHDLDVVALHAGLLNRSVRTVLHRSRDNMPRLSFILTATQTARCIDHAIDALAQTMCALTRCGASHTLLPEVS